MNQPAPLPAITELSRQDLAAWCESHDQAAFRADQIRRWIFGKRVGSFAEMHDVSLPFRNLMAEHFSLFQSEVVQHHVASDRTEKLLLKLSDGEHVECVLMRETSRRTVCISTQVGCAMGCVFCASGLLGLKRNLSTGEILEQILHLDRLLGPNENITNVVVMGIGEPLANLPALLPALETLNHKGGFGLGARRITISTVGLPEKIRELSKLKKQYNLAVSLHAPNDASRNELVPVNQNIGIEEILKAADEYFETTTRRVTYEYVLLAGQNDSPAQAKELANLLKGRNAHVNLIPMNPVAELEYHEPQMPRTQGFLDQLVSLGTNATIRKRKGEDIEAACGQLRLEQINLPAVPPVSSN